MPKVQAVVRLARSLDSQLTRAGEQGRAAAIAPASGPSAPQSPLQVINSVLKTTFQFALRNPWFRVAVIVIGALLVQAGLALSVMVVVMFVHPGGIGMEKLAGPIFGFFALLLFLAGGTMIYLGVRVKPSGSAS